MNSPCMQPSRRWLPLLALAALLLLPGCANIGKEATFGAGLTGLDHLTENYLSVSSFSLNGTFGFQAGKGGSTVCCATLPEHWHPGLTAHVEWGVRNWKDTSQGRHYKADVLVDPYSETGHIYVHFLADGTVRVVVTNAGLFADNYPGPHDLIPDKYPWKDYPPTIQPDITELFKKYREEHPDPPTPPNTGEIEHKPQSPDPE